LSVRFVQPIHDDRLHRAGGCSAQDAEALCIIGIGIVHERFLATELENVRRKWNALCVSLAPIQVNRNSHMPGAPFSDMDAL
jgi:hypothetical protein